MSRVPADSSPWNFWVRWQQGTNHKSSSFSRFFHQLTSVTEPLIYCTTSLKRHGTTKMGWDNVSGISCSFQAMNSWWRQNLPGMDPNLFSDSHSFIIRQELHWVSHPIEPESTLELRTKETDKKVSMLVLLNQILGWQPAQVTYK